MPTLEQLVRMAAKRGVLEQVVADLPEPVVRKLLGTLVSLREQLTLGDVAKLLEPNWRPRPHLDFLEQQITAAVADVENGISRRLVITMPARHGKSTLCSEALPSWILDTHPDWPVALVSSEATLPYKWSRTVRRAIEEGKLPHVQLAPDSKAVSEWETTEGGGLVARGWTGSLIGRGAKVMVIDDIVRDFKAAHSSEQREAIRNWWATVGIQRLEPPYLVLYVATRWHEDDLAATLIGQGFEEIRLPALAEQDDPLGREPGAPLLSPLVDEDPEQALERWAALKTAIGSYMWASQGQQHPAPPKGQVFDVAWWQWWSDDGRDDSRVFHPVQSNGSGPRRWLTSWDCAFKGTADSDWVVGQVWCVIGADRFLVDQVRGRWTFTETLAQMSALAQRWPWIGEHLVEDKANGTAVIDTLKRKIAGLIPINPGSDSKLGRAQAAAPVVEAGNVYLPHTATAVWVADLVSEFRFFPHGTHDDQVDAATQALNRLRTTSNAPTRMQRAVGALPR